MNPYVMEAVAAERVRDLHAAAERYHRVALARAGRPSRFAAARAGIARSTHTAREWFRRGQLGPVATTCITC
jgi:hypothetical protein